MAVVNFKDREPGTPQITTYPAGTYTAEVMKFERATSQKGNPQLKVNLKFKKPDDYYDKDFVEWISLTEKVMWKVIDFFWACGVDNKKLPNIDTSSELFMNMCNQLKGRELGLELSIRVYNGKDTNDVDRYLRVCDDELELDAEGADIPDFLRK